MPWRHSSYTSSQICDVRIMTLSTQIVQRLFKVEQIFPILTTWAYTVVDLGCNIMRQQRAQELRIIWHADVDQTVDIRSSRICGMELCVLDAVAVDFTDVEILSNLLDMVRLDVIRDTPDIVFVQRHVLLQKSQRTTHS